MSYNTLVLDYGNNSTQVRFYNSPVLHGKELEEKKKRNKQIKEFKQRLEDKKNVNKQIEFDFNSVSTGVVKNARDVVGENNKRAKRNIYELARSNAWEYFITFTFNPSYVDSTDYDTVVKKVQNFITTVKRSYSPDLKYLIVPEYHKDGKKFHFHGLLSNCGNLNFVDSGFCTKDGAVIYNLLNFNWGFTEATKVIDTHRVSSYICKYMTKDTTAHIFGRRRYLASNNLDKPEKKYLKLDFDDRKLLIDSIGEVKHSKSVNAFRKVVYLEL